MKNTKKLVSLLLVVMLTVTAVVSAGVSASALDGTLSSYYATNPDGKFGAQKTITVDGSISDWDSTMLIAQGTANDDPRVYRENSMHENPIDLYALYGAYDDSNLYLMWEMTNVQDMVAAHLDYPLAQGHLYQTENVPFYIAIDTGKSDVIGNGGKTPTGGTLWGSNIAVETSYNRMIAISTNGSNGPYIYGGDSTGINPVEIYNPSTAGITFKWGEGILSTQVNGIDKGFGTNNGRVPGDVSSDASNWVNFTAKGHNSSKYDFHYEMSIPLSKLGITKSDITTNGIGAMLIATFGKSGMDCLPYDLTMNDNADQPDTESQAINSYEKSDEDTVTVPFARIGAQGGDTPQPVTQPTTEEPTQEPTEATQPTQPTDPPVGDTLTVNAKSNYFNTSTMSGLEVGDTVTVKYDLTSNYGLASTQWRFNYDAAKLRLLTPTDSLSFTGSEINATAMPIKGNYTTDNFVDCSAGKTFLEAQFEVLGTGSTDVTLTVDELNIGYKSGNTVYIGTPVEGGQIQNINSQTGFSNATLTPTSIVTETTPQVDEGLTVTATSNLFKNATVAFEPGTGKVTVAYQLKSSRGVINTQWVASYDASKLRLDYAAMPKISSPAIATPLSGIVTGNYASVAPVSYTAIDDFAVFTFDVIGSGETTVDLNVDLLGVGYKSGVRDYEAYLVDDGEVQDITSVSGFARYIYSTATQIYEGTTGVLRGDVDDNGVVNINDATEIQRFLAEYTTLTSRQILAADADKNGRVSIKDVTQIQRALAEFIQLAA